ncbi:MAG: GntR family transcriptional regulator [Candidatus Velthaea sp.]
MPDAPSTLTPPRRPEPLRDQIYDKVHAAIISGELPPGSPVVEADLAAKLGASRTPIREALHRLEAEGLVERKGVRGMAVREMARDEARCIFEIREALETLAARRAARRISRAQIEQLAQIVDRMSASVNDGPAYDALDTEFHDLLLAWSDGDRLKRMLNEVRDDVHAWRALAIKSAERRRASAAEHEAIIAALRAGDEDAVARAMVDHIAHARDAVISA